MNEFLSDEQKRELTRLAEIGMKKPWTRERFDYKIRNRYEERQLNLLDEIDKDYIVMACNTVPALLAEIEALQPDALKMREINAKAEELSAQFNADYHFGLPQAHAGPLNRRLAIAIEALERIMEMPSDLQYCRDEPNPKRCPTCCAREALLKLNL